MMIYLFGEGEKQYFLIDVLHVTYTVTVARTSLRIARCGYLSCGYFLLGADWVVLIVCGC